MTETHDTTQQCVGQSVHEVWRTLQKTDFKLILIPFPSPLAHPRTVAWFLSMLFVGFMLQPGLCFVVGVGS